MDSMTACVDQCLTARHWYVTRKRTASDASCSTMDQGPRSATTLSSSRAVWHPLLQLQSMAQNLPPRYARAAAHTIDIGTDLLLRLIIARLNWARMWPALAAIPKNVLACCNDTGTPQPLKCIVPRWNHASGWPCTSVQAFCCVLFGAKMHSAAMICLPSVLFVIAAI